MSFLDSLENSLKSFEAQEERSSNEGSRRQGDRSRALAVAPWATQLKTSAWTSQLFEQSAIAGHRIRAKIYIAWFDTTLRLEVRGRALELLPTPEGIVAHYVTLEGDTVTEPVDLNGDPDQLLAKWLAGEKPLTRQPVPVDDLDQV